VVLPPPDVPGADGILPGGVGLLDDAFFYLGLLGVRRMLVPGVRPDSLQNVPAGASILAEPAMTAREASALAAGTGRFLLMDSGVVRRQDVRALLQTPPSGTSAMIALSSAAQCGGLPLLTSPEGRVTGTDSPGEATNAADSGLWLCDPAMAAMMPEGRLEMRRLLIDLVAAGESLAAEFCEGYTRRPGTPIQYLMACGDVLQGRLQPWSGMIPADGGVLLEDGAEISATVRVSGFLWARRGSRVAHGSALENVVLMPRSSVGEGCDLRNALVPAGFCVRSGTISADRAPKVLGR
jgi:hypothetical protein